MVVNPTKYIGTDFINCILWVMIAMLESKLEYDSLVVCVAVFMAILMAVETALDFQLLKDQEEIIAEADKIMAEIVKEEEDKNDNED